MSETLPPQHSVRVVARRTGLTPDLLRAWERRYRVVEPTRSAGGQRNYSDADIERLQLLVKVTAAGRPIGQVAALGNAELRELAAADRSAHTVDATELEDPAVDHFREVALGAAENFDANLLESTLRTAALQLPSDRALDGVIGPLLLEIGSRWEQGRFPPANEHLATTVIRRVLTWMSDFPATPAEHARTIVIATPATQLHDLGAMLAATVAATSGWRVAFLGASLPADELARAARLANADTVALSMVYSSDPAHVSGQLRQLRSELPPSVALVIGGAGAAAHADVLMQIGAHRLDSLAALRAWLTARGQGGEPGQEPTFPD